MPEKGKSGMIATLEWPVVRNPAQTGLKLGQRVNPNTKQLSHLAQRPTPHISLGIDPDPQNIPSRDDKIYTKIYFVILFLTICQPLKYNGTTRVRSVIVTYK